MKNIHTFVALAGALGALFAGAEASAIEPMSPQQIVDLGKHAVGYSYWWGHGRFRTDKASTGSCSGSCPGCTHTGQYGGDCSGFVAKAWQIPKPIPIDQDAHPYSTYHFTNQTSHWTDVPKASAALADSFVYNENGAGHIFLHEKGDPWGYVHAYECKGCSYGCTYGSRKADAKYKVIRRNALTGGCEAHCEGSKIVGDDCGVGDCAAYGATCVDDALGVRCVFAACPPTGKVTVCLDDETLGDCDNGQITTGDCGTFASYCSTAGGQPAHCASAFCVGSPKDVPVAHDICFLDGKRYHCDASGQPTEKPCGAGSQCSTYPDVHCQQDLGCPASGQGTSICLDAHVMAECHEGAAVNASDCAEIGSYCSTALGGEPRCIPTVCVAGPGELPSDKATCTADGQLALCKADGSVTLSSCPGDTHCIDGACVPWEDPAGSGGGGSTGSSSTGSSGTSGQGGSAGGAAGGQWNAGGQEGSAGNKGKLRGNDALVSTGEERESGGCAVSAPGALARASGWVSLLLVAGSAARRRRRALPAHSGATRRVEAGILRTTVLHEAQPSWRSGGGMVTISTHRLPIVDVAFRGPMPSGREYEETFQEYARLAERGQPLLWLIDMNSFEPLGADATTRKQASEVFHRYHHKLRPVSVAEARVTSDRLTRFMLTAFDWLTISDKWPCQQFATTTEAEAWLWSQYEKRRR